MERQSIKILSQELQNQIAAGEVVGRPSSVVKELLENSLDAGASQLDLTLENGGQTLISLQDNGYGIAEDELELAVTHHATSKLSKIEHLNCISSYGFRGEALPSIASVARLRVASVVQGAEATELLFEFGKMTRKAPAVLNVGTIVEVRDLFANIPARIKFLKSPASEQKKCQEIFMRMALARSDVAMSLFVGSRCVLNYPKEQSLLDRLSFVWQDDMRDQLLVCDKMLGRYKISGYVSKPSLANPKADKIYLYVNGRAIINDKLILKAIKDAYKGRMVGRDYPRACLFIDLPPEEVDVNVHPAKSEVRFRDEQYLYLAVLKAVQDALNKSQERYELIYEPSATEAKILADNSPLQPLPDDFYAKRNQDGFWGKADGKSLVQNADKLLLERPEKTNYEDVQSYQVENPEKKSEMQSGIQFGIVPEMRSEMRSEMPNNLTSTSSSFSSGELFNFDANLNADLQLVQKSSIRYLGQIASTYLVFDQGGDSLLLLDQHAVHERILYDQYKKGVLAGHSISLLLAIEKDLTNLSLEYFLDEIAPQIVKFGFKYTLKENILSITSIPACMDRQNALNFLQEALDHRKNAEDFATLWISHACKTAIKAGDALTEQSVLQLIEAWLRTEEPDYCPHGRPCAKSFKNFELEKMFKRGI